MDVAVDNNGHRLSASRSYRAGDELVEGKIGVRQITAAPKYVDLSELEVASRVGELYIAHIVDGKSCRDEHDKDCETYHPTLHKVVA